MFSELPFKMTLNNDQESWIIAHAFPASEDSDHCIYGPQWTKHDGERIEWWLGKNRATPKLPRTLVFGHYWENFIIEFENETRICIDSGCVDGGSLTALRYPEKTFIRIPSKYCFTYK
jgi:hypothetical protein